MKTKYDVGDEIVTQVSKNGKDIWGDYYEDNSIIELGEKLIIDKIFITKSGITYECSNLANGLIGEYYEHEINLVPVKRLRIYK